jgi:hypothetical protein
MENRTVLELLELNYSALRTVKGHNKKTVKTCILLLNAFNNEELELSVRNNTATPTNAGDIAECLVGYMLDRKDFMGVSLNCNDLNTIKKNEVKLCYSNNRPSNDIQDKGFYMIDTLLNQVRLTFINRTTFRACKSYLIKGKRGGNTFAQACISYQS